MGAFIFKQMSDINDPISRNIEGVKDLVTSRTNKIPMGAGGDGEGVVGEEIDILELPMTDEELLALATSTENEYKGYEGKIKARQDGNLKYYLGRQAEGGSQVVDQPISANLIFESEEVFLAAALAKNPEPVVYADNTDEGNKVSNEVKTTLQYHADSQNLRQKLTLMTRNWTYDLLSAMKHGWDSTTSDITSEVRDVKKFVFDKDGYVDSYGDFIGMLGEKISSTAKELADLFPKFKDFITVMVDGKMGTEVVRTEWWTDEYTFTTFKGKVLDKSKNPHFNYEEGKNNHFARPKKPYSFLAVFSIQTQPHDITSLIEQTIPNQNRVTRRTEQLDYNLSRSNNSDVFSADNFTQETAKQAAMAMRKGNPIIVPPGKPIEQAIHRLQAPTVGGEFFNALENDKGDVRSIFGVQGITAQKPEDDQTARGMILNQQYDNSRIGGGIGDKLETTAKSIFNQWVQLYHVYYDVEHFAAVLGQMKATEYVVLSSANLTRSVVVSVSPDSMKPKDETTIMNQSLALWEAKALDIKTLLTMLDYPDPQKTAAQVWLYQSNPQAYGALNFPELTQQLQALAASGTQGGQPPQQGGGQPSPEQANGEPAQPLSGVNANSSLSTVALPK